MKTHECKVNRWKWALPSFQGWIREEMGAERMWDKLGGAVGGGCIEGFPQLNRCCWHSWLITVSRSVYLILQSNITLDGGSVCCVRGCVLLVSPLSFAGQLICSSCNKACCCRACVSVSTVAPSKILAFGSCPSCCLLDEDLLLACVPISTFRHVTCALLSRDGAQIPSLMLCLTFWMIPCTRPRWKRTFCVSFCLVFVCFFS